ncbi:fungal-specific transcription factor domain-containing protein [Lipomyces tetrasporus]|uniref:Fungal-specific transcription factor domain-containing protein n=1 Tax=Lipomyces tetrasporus TaxID=54092 RepID=A0AAD7QK58_9ASCO|nr:fungal-specific transcription factor domain-containing protein [Lipomyces tetrasporus]KAJ8096706.1 fungal-specific transcription factor domain-containing protein [Lipomyces tetrasporus]
MVTRQPSAAGQKSDIFVYESANASGSSAADDKSTQSPTGTTKRTARACVRCRKQKLKCDSYRPCALCVRANVVCVSRPDGPTETKKTETTDVPASQISHGVQASSKYTSAPTTSTIGLPPLASLTESMSIGLPPPQSTIISQDPHDSRPVKLRRLLYPEPGDSTSYGSGSNDVPRSTPFRSPDESSAISLNFPSSRSHVRLSEYPDKALPSTITQDVHYTHKSDSSFAYLSQITANSGIDSLLNRRPISPTTGTARSASVRSNSSAASDIERHSSLPWTHTRSTTATVLAYLPPRPIMNYAIAVYFNSVQWFLFVAHEGQFLEQYHTLLAAYEADPSKVPDTDEDFTFALLLVVVIALGGRYIVVHPGRRKRLAEIYGNYMQLRSPGSTEKTYDLEKAMAQLIALSRAHLLDTLSCCTLSTVQTCILLGSFCLYHGDPNLAWSIFGSGLKSAQALGLHREDLALKEEKRQLRRRVFWALYNYDRFAAMSYGRPLGIHDDDCDVELPTVTTSYPSHDKSSYLMVEDDVKDSAGQEPATLLTYQVCKLQFYIILGEIISKLYRQGSRGIAKHAKQFESSESESDRFCPLSVDYLVSTIQSLEAKLKQWYDHVPDVLKLRDDGSHTPNESTDSDDEDDIIIPDHDDANRDSVSVKARRARIKRDIFSMQAVLLQVQFDNAMIILHRPLLAFQNPPQSPLRNPSSSDPFSQSANACWQAALRTSRLASHSAFTKIQYSHGVAFVGIQLFTAGVLLSVFGSSEPLSQRALESKRGLSRIIQMQKALKVKIIVADQGFRILENLARVVVQKEMEKILSGGPYADQSQETTDSPDGSGKDDDDRSAAVMLTRLSYHLNGHASNDKSPQALDAVENQTFNESLLNFERVMFSQTNGLSSDGLAIPRGANGLHDPHQAWIWSYSYLT